eukprot:TRINITY_DN9885_c0_g1_i3.p1 TRINITY_DN9885_c0_g1~~TRINITY_DN9885_c0_g1_i3.p1  ORF type:complete len:315 (+),score=84.46 TRINITY_DN9885_c0_g1_i3:61-945(+)
MCIRDRYMGVQTNNQNILMRLARRVLVTGANQGVGLALMNRILREQPRTNLLFTSRNQKKGEEVLKTLRAKYPAAQLDFHLLEILNERSRTDLVEYIKKTGDTFDVLVNNAGLGEGPDTNRPAGEVPDAPFAQLVLTTNVEGTVLLTESLLGQLSENGKILSGSSHLGALKFHGPKAQKLLNDPSITTERVFELIETYVKGCKRGDIGDWHNSVYGVSKALVNAWNRFALTKKLNGAQVSVAVSHGTSEAEGADSYYRLIFGVPFGVDAQKYKGQFVDSNGRITDYENLSLIHI